MAVGVPEHEVFAAADTVLARGERPTVERVRLELGRGSPARVGGLLDQWWEQLAGRLRGETRLPELPTEVAQAFVAIWQQATTMAQGVVEQSVAGQRQVLMEEREQLAMLETRAGLEAAQARQKAAEAEATRQVMETRLADQEQLSDQRQAQIRDLQHQRDRLLQERSDALLRSSSLEQELQALRHEVEQARIQQESYLRSVEDRSYREIDRAREESKGFATQLKQANLQLVGRQQQLEVVHAELSEARQQAASQRSRADILSEQLMLQSSSKPSSKPKIRNRATMASTRKT